MMPGSARRRSAILFGIGGDLLYIEIVIGESERLFLFQDGFPAETGLIDLHNKTTRTVRYRRELESRNLYRDSFCATVFFLLVAWFR